MIGLIVAYANNKVIGNNGSIPWRIKGEQSRFKKLTTGNVVVMGRRSYEEIGRPLPDRVTMVVSSQKNFDKDGCITVSSLEEALEKSEGKHVFIAGGARLYQEALPIVDRMYVTEIELDVQGDTFFPEFDEKQFKKVIDSKNTEGIPFTYVTYIRE